MEVTLQSNIDAFNRAFAEYVNWTSKTPQQALERKVRNIGIRLWRGFTAHQFGGVPRQRGIAIRQLAQRTAEKRGTAVRPELLAQYESQRDALLKERREIKQRGRWGTLNDWSGMASALLSNAMKRIGAWQELVGKEVAIRQAGIGELGAAFLWYRYRGEGENRRVVLNRTGRPMGSVTVEDGAATIVGEVAGLTTVDARYGVVAQAIDDETDDTLSWVKDQQEQNWRRIMGGLAA